jgi:hypothetical protein
MASTEQGILPNSPKTAKLDAVLFTNRLTFSVNKKLKADYIKFWKDKLSLDGSEEKGNKLRTYRKLKEKYAIEPKIIYLSRI